MEETTTVLDGAPENAPENAPESAFLEEQESEPDMGEEDNGEDMLLAQIDAFRNKAKQLQNMISVKERKVKELEALVRSKELQNAQLQESLQKKQKEADGIVWDVNVQVDRMMQDLRENMEKLEEKIQTQVSHNENAAAEQTKNVKDTLAEMNQGLDTMRSDLSEKVHSENVKVYRNIQDLLKELDDRENEASMQETRFHAIKRQNVAVICFGVFNILLTGVVILLYTGIL